MSTRAWELNTYLRQRRSTGRLCIMSDGPLGPHVANTDGVFPLVSEVSAEAVNERFLEGIRARREMRDSQRWEDWILSLPVAVQHPSLNELLGRKVLT